MNDAELGNVAARLHNVVRSGKCVAWLGSGLSRCASLPDWRQLIDKLCDACDVVKPEAVEGVDSKVLMEKADECKRSNGGAYESVLGALFGKRPSDTRLAYGLVTQLPFRAFVTTNYDALLAYEAARNRLNNLYHYPDLDVSLLGSSSHPVFYIHGLACVNGQACGENLVLSKSEFDAAYGDSGSVGAFLATLFTYHPVLFLGCRLQEPHIRDSLRRARMRQEHIHEARGNQGSPTKLILLSPEPVRAQTPVGIMTEEDVTNGAFERERLELKQLGVDSVRFDPKEDGYPEIERILELVCERENLHVVPKSSMALSEDLPQP